MAKIKKGAIILNLATSKVVITMVLVETSN